VGYQERATEEYKKEEEHNLTRPTYMNFTRHSQFMKMRKENPKLYHSFAVQNAIHDLAQKYGMEFFETPKQQEPGSNSSSSSSGTDTSSLFSSPKSTVDKEEKLEALRRYQRELQEKIEDLENTEISYGDNNEQV
jgi:hypothetical protein